MMVLPSGRIIDISTDRSRYHCLRQQGIDPDCNHRKLYSLVDIVYRKIDDAGDPKRGWTEYDYEFSGLTLDTVRGDSDWSEEDVSALYRWVQHVDQRRRIEMARRRLINNEQQLTVKHYSSSKYLYSLLRQRLMALPLQRATAEHWLATMDNLKKKGVRDEEIEWSGLRRYLLQKRPGTDISKKQLLDSWNNSNLRIELCTEQIWGSNGGLNFVEVAQCMPHQAVYRATLKLDANCLCVMRYLDTCCNYRVGVVKTLNKDHRMALNKYWFALDPYGRAIANMNAGDPVDGGQACLFFDNSADAKMAANEHARDTYGISSGARAHTQYDHLTLFGGYDYREWFVTLPDHQRIFYGAHFHDHNILSHIRTTTRTDNTGRKILFIEEVQSDWHRSGRRSGYDNSSWGRVANAPFKKEWPVLAVKLMLIHASQNGFSGIAWASGDIQQTRYKGNIQAIKRYYDNDIPEALSRLGKNMSCTVEVASIETRDPWLNIERAEDKWLVADGQGKFKTRARYENRDEAMAVIARHSRSIELQVPAFYISDDLRRQIAEKGLPLYGHTIA